MFLLNCFFAAFAERFMLPMMASVLSAIMITVGAILDQPTRT